jgi:hypothetical protein
MTRPKLFELRHIQSYRARLIQPFLASEVMAAVSPRLERPAVEPGVSPGGLLVHKSMISD